MSFTELPTIQKEELIVSLASLILADGEVAVNVFFLPDSFILPSVEGQPRHSRWEER